MICLKFNLKMVQAHSQTWVRFVSALAVACLAMRLSGVSAAFLAGIGKSDITGPVADVNLMG